MWRKNVTAADGTLITLANSYPEFFWTNPNKVFDSPHNARIISPHPFTGIAVQPWLISASAGATTANIEIWGMMFPDSKVGPGPATLLYATQLTDTASTTWGASDVPIQNQDITAGTYRGGRFAAATTVDYSGSAGGALLTDAQSNADILLLSTVGYSHLLFQVVGGVAQLTSLTILWRGISKEGVI